MYFCTPDQGACLSGRRWSVSRTRPRSSKSSGRTWSGWRSVRRASSTGTTAPRRGPSQRKRSAYTGLLHILFLSQTLIYELICSVYMRSYWCWGLGFRLCRCSWPSSATCWRWRSTVMAAELCYQGDDIAVSSATTWICVLHATQVGR